MKLVDIIKNSVENHGVKSRAVDEENIVDWLTQQTQGRKPQDINQYMAVIKRMSGLFNAAAQYFDENDIENDFLKGQLNRDLNGYINNTIPNAIELVEDYISFEDKKSHGQNTLKTFSALGSTKDSLYLFNLFTSTSMDDIRLLEGIGEDRVKKSMSYIAQTLNHAHKIFEIIYSKLGQIYSNPENK